jgi:hypothetical protein
MSNNLSTSEAKSLDMVRYLETLGYCAQKIRGHDWWYLSPLRDEKTPSFKVDRKLNLWYDHGIGKGGNLVDFGVLFFQCSVKEFLQKLMKVPAQNFSFHPPLSSQETSPESEEKKLLITSVHPLISPRFYYYISSRRINLAIANQYVKEVAFELKGKPYTALGFKNNSGGYELRNEHFKGSSSPKDVTVIDRDHSENVAVFEGFFSFLSYLSFAKKMEGENCHFSVEENNSFLILNSLSFLEKSRPLMETHASIQLYLDRDGAGVKATEKALHWSHRYKDKSSLYQGHKDFNDFLIHQEKIEQRQSHRRGRHL